MSTQVDEVELEQHLRRRLREQVRKIHSDIWRVRRGSRYILIHQALWIKMSHTESIAREKAVMRDSVQ